MSFSHTLPKYIHTYIVDAFVYSHRWDVKRCMFFDRPVLAETEGSGSKHAVIKSLPGKNWNSFTVNRLKFENWSNHVRFSPLLFGFSDQRKTTRAFRRLTNRYLHRVQCIVRWVECCCWCCFCWFFFFFLCRNCFPRVFDICVTFPVGIPCNFYEVSRPNI